MKYFIYFFFLLFNLHFPFAKANILSDFKLEALNLAQQNLLPNNINIIEGKNEKYFYSPGLAKYSFIDDTCTIEVHSDVWAKSHFTSKWSKKYFIYHELMHCRLYNNPVNFFNETNLNEYTKKILNDFFYAELLKASSNKRMQINGFWFMHEAYADLLSLALLINQGMPEEELFAFLKLREINFMDAVHSFNLKADDFSEIKNKSTKEIDLWLNKKMIKILSSFWHKTYAKNQEIDFYDIMKNNALGSKMSYFNSQKYGYSLSEEELEIYNEHILPIMKAKNKKYSLYYNLATIWDNHEDIDKQWLSITNNLYNNPDKNKINKEVNLFFTN